MTTPALITRWHEAVENRDPSILDSILAEDAVMLSPVVHTPQRGNEHFKYTREVYGDGFAVLEFETQMDGKYVNGVDMITWNDQDQITEFKVMVRPLQGINALHKAMGEALEKFKTGQSA